MSTMTLKGAKGEGDFFRLHFWGAVLLVLGALLALGAFPAHAAPLAGTSIGNQASASYTDANSVARITVSNSVSTIVQQVGNATMTQSQSKVAAPGQTIAFPHTITNNGNGPDTFTLTLGGTITGSANLAATPTNSTVFFADNNCDGVADSNAPTNTIGPVAAGAQGCFVAQLTAGTTAGASAAIDITFASAFGGTLTGNPNTDTLTISANAVINVSKSISISTGPSGTRVVYQLTYRNTGTVSAGNVVIADVVPTGVTIVTGTARWSAASTGALTEAAGDVETVGGGASSPYGIRFGRTGQALFAILQRVDPGVQGFIEYQADIAGASGTYLNNAQWCYQDRGSNTTTAVPPQPTSIAGVQTACSTIITASNASAFNAVWTPPVNLFNPGGELSVITGNTNTATVTNTVPFYIPSVGAAGAVVFNDNAGSSTDGTNPMVTLTQAQALADGDANIAVATAGQGTLATWDVYVWNTGAGTDTFNVYPPTAGATVSNFPAGTTFLLFRSDGFTPLTDSNNDGVVDTGPVNAAGSYLVRVVAVLPPSGAAGTYNAILTAQSTNTTSSTNTVGVRLRIVGSRVDVRNYLPAAGGNGQTIAGEVLGPVNTVSANPGTNALFGLAIVNTGTIADSYDLSYNVTSGAYTVATGFTTVNALPSGFVLKFYQDNGSACTNLGAEVNNTGVIQPGATRNICAVVTIPQYGSAGDYELYFRALSPTTWNVGDFTTSSADVKRDRLTVNLLRSVAISPNNSGQGFPGGSVQYCHTITNAGNGAESALVITQSNQSLNGTTGWGQYATFYADTNRNCILDGTETASPASSSASVTALAAGATTNIIVVVQVPGAAVAGQTNVSTFTLSGSPGITTAVATDTTTVVLGQISLVKDQRLDAACNTTFDAATLDGLTYAQTQITTGAVPGACIIYRVRATNVGTQSVTAVTINDVAPPNTTRHATAISGATNACTPGAPAAPNVSCTIATLTGGSTTTMYFRVRIDP